MNTPVIQTITGWTETIDNGGTFDPLSGIYTVAATGTYELTAVFTYQHNASMSDQLDIPAYFGISDPALIQDYGASYMVYMDAYIPNDTDPPAIFYNSLLANGTVTVHYIGNFSATDQIVTYWDPNGTTAVPFVFNLMNSTFAVKRIG